MSYSFQFFLTSLWRLECWEKGHLKKKKTLISTHLLLRLQVRDMLGGVGMYASEACFIRGASSGSSPHSWSCSVGASAGNFMPPDNSKREALTHWISINPEMFQGSSPARGPPGIMQGSFSPNSVSYALWTSKEKWLSPRSTLIDEPSILSISAICHCCSVTIRGMLPRVKVRKKISC